MSRWLSLLVVSASLVLAEQARAQLSPDKALESMSVADGLQIELFAAEPMLINPTSIDVDHKGRVWVCEAVNYRRIGFNRPILRPEGDRIVILEDTDGDGKADKSTVFYQGKDLIAPIGIAVAKDAVGPGYKVFVCQSPDILLFEDKDGDGKADGPPKKLLTGFKGFDHDHGVHGINIGPDGKLYFTVGDQGVDGLQSSDGKGRKWKTNHTDCQAGTVWRCDMDGTNLELIAHNFRNNYECCVNSFGEIWLSDNDDDGNQQTRICYVMPGGNYGYWPRGPGQSHWHEEQPGIVHKVLRTGFGSPTGICFYEGTLLPEKYRGQLLHTDAGPREFRCFHIKPKGAGYELEKEVLVTSKDTWFRLSDVCVAPDGSVMLADWYDPGVGGHGMGDWTRGRIYRVTPKGHKGYKVPEVTLRNATGLLAALGSPCQATRALARSKYESIHPDDVIESLFNTCNAGEDPFLRARAVWIFLATMLKAKVNDSDPAVIDLVRKAMGSLGHDPDPRIMCLLIRPFGNFAAGKKKLPNGNTEAFVNIGLAAPLREILLVSHHLTAEEFKPQFFAIAKQYDGQDHFYLAALNIACGTDPQRRAAILADFDKQFPEWNDKVADLAWELRPKGLSGRLNTLLFNGKLAVTQKRRIVEILGVSDDVEATGVLLNLLRSDEPAELKALAIDNLRLNLPTKWSSYREERAFVLALDDLLKDEKRVITGLQLVGAAQAASAQPQVEAIAGDEKRPLPVRVEAVRALGQYPRRDSVTLALVKIAKSDAGLAIECVKVLTAHLPNTQVYAHSQGDALKYLQDLVISKTAARELRLAAVAALAGNRHGSSALLYWKEKNELPDDLIAETGRILRNSPNQETRNRAVLLFPAAGKLDLKKLPPITELSKRTGNAEKGKQVFSASAKSDAQCLRCHMVRGTGGQIGPDLSMIGKKASRENLFESILQPSKAIADQYLQWKVDTLDGASVTGLIVEETKEAITLRDANGKDTKIRQSDIDKKTKSPISIMPDNLAAALTEDELIDMVEYLLTLKTPALTPDAWNIVGPFPNDERDSGLDKSYGPETGPAAVDRSATYRGKNGPVRWHTVRPNAQGYVDLQAHYAPNSAHITSYLDRVVESPKDQEATILLGNDDGVKLWVNRQQVFVNRDHNAAAPEQHKIPVKLNAGTNNIVLKIVNGNDPHGFYFTIVSEEELKLVPVK
jgi:putative membrane-bound dehydrogenase-like protein